MKNMGYEKSGRPAIKCPGLALHPLAAWRLRDLPRQDGHVPRLFPAKRQVITAQPEFNRVPQRGAADDLDLSAVTEPHLKQSPPQFRIASDGNDASPAPNPQLVEPAGFRLSRMIARGKIARLFHGLVSRSLERMLSVRSYHNWLRLSFNDKIILMPSG
jgi:hypothetical protein